MGKIVKLMRPEAGRYLIRMGNKEHNVTIGSAGPGVYRRVTGPAPTGSFVLGGSVLHIADNAGALVALLSRSEDYSRVDGHATLVPAWGTSERRAAG